MSVIKYDDFGVPCAACRGHCGDDAMTELEQLCENALYDEIRVLEDGKSVVRDIPTGKLYFKKILDVYNEHVFAYLRDHKNKNVSAVQAFWKDGGNLIVIEELIQGRTLDEILTEGEASFAERINILTQICDGLHFLHSAEPPIIHRDIKASNIMVTDDEIVKIIDYDAAKIYISGLKKDTVMIGTQGVAAPEQYGFAQSDVRTDLYALGKLIERMLPGNVDAKRIADKATEMDPKKRFASAEQMKGQIRKIREHNSALDQKLEKISGYDPMNRSHRIRARIGLALFSTAAAFLIFLAGWQLFVYPGQRAQQQQAEMAVIAEAKTADDGLVNAVKSYTGTYSYQQMRRAEKKAFRDTMEDAFMRCFRDGREDDAKEVRNILTKRYGEEATWEAVYKYGEIDYNIGRKHYGEAVTELSALRESGAEGAQEHWDAAVRQILENARSDMSASVENASPACLRAGLEAYLCLINNSAQIEGADLRKELDEKCTEVLNKAQSLREQKNWDVAINIYKAMQEVGIENSLPDGSSAVTGGLDTAELICGTQYEHAESLLAEKSYDKAAGMFEELGDYSDARNMNNECFYRKACDELENDSFGAAALTFDKISGYKDSYSLGMQSKYSYCELKKKDPDDAAYTYISELVNTGYEGAEELKNEMYQWHVSISNGLSYSLGPMQAAYIKAALTGGPREGSGVLTFEIYDFTRGTTDTWSDGKEYKRGETAEVTYSEQDSSYDLFDRKYRVRVYVNGDLAETWEGQFSREF